MLPAKAKTKEIAAVTPGKPTFFKSLILIAFFISVPSLLYSLGYINQNKFLILITICIIFLIIYFMFRKKSNRELQIINNDNELYKAKKIKDFKFKNKYHSK